MLAVRLADGLVASLAAPGRNVTGLSNVVFGAIRPADNHTAIACSQHLQN
jgi:hypothetical protein